MAQETEIKLKINDLRAFQRMLKRLGAVPVDEGSGRVHETNVIFDTPQGGLAKHGQLLRIRTETSEKGGKGQGGKGKNRVGKTRFVVTFKRPVIQPSSATGSDSRQGRYKIREEVEAEVTDAGSLTNIFEGLGMRGWFQYEKYRTTFKLPSSESWAKGLLIELDETPIGTFVELEGPREGIDRVAEMMGFSKHDYVLKNYLALYVEDCRKRGEEPRNMTFPSRKSEKN